MNKAGRLGEKTGSGFYLHKARKAVPDPGVQEVLAAARAASGLDKVRPGPRPPAPPLCSLLPQFLCSCLRVRGAAGAGVRRRRRMPAPASVCSNC